MHVIKSRSNRCGNKKLGIIGIWATVGHGQHPDLIVLMNEILILECVSVYTFSTCSIPVCYVTALDHEPWDYPVEFASFVVEVLATYSFSFFPGAKTFKIFSCFRDVCVQLKYYFSLLNPIYSDLNKRTISLPIMHVPL